MRTEDGYIVNQCINGDSAAFGLLVDKYKPSIYALAYSRLRNFHDAEDITQEVFIKAYQKLSTLRRWDSFLAWLYAITSNLCRDLMRERAKRPDGEFIKDKNARFFDYPSINSYQQEQLYESLHEALDSLPQTYRDVLTLYYLGGMASKEIAQFLGTSPAAIRQRLSRARSKLKKEMLDMMSKTYDEQRLQPSFTFRIVEMVQRIKIKPAPSKPLLPLGLSAATGIVLTVLMFSPHLISLTPLGALLGSPLPSETKVMEVGELPVDVLEISEITFLSSEQGDDDGGVAKLPNAQNAFAPPLAPPGEVGKWTRKADMPTARTGTSASVVDGKIYVIGGGKDKALSIVEEYNPATDTWTKKTDMPTPRAWFSTSEVNRNIYAIGGGRDFNVSLSTVEVYNPATDTWTKKTAMPTPRWGLSTSVVDGKIYAIGGSNPPPAVVSTVEEYDPAADTWTKKADMPTPRAGLFTGVVNGKIYAIGGFLNLTRVTSTVEEYDPTTDTWTKKADMPTARGWPATSVVNGKIYAIGGALNINVSVSTVEVYDPAIDRWTKKADMLTARMCLSTSIVNGYIYAIGGATSQPAAQFPFPALSIVEVYDTGFRAVEPEGKLPTTWGEMKAE
ncbi:sigma-70 family RNA polymerase sigma factor [bacterium]|nr:sigma-70 family RNA polymerase sigma factor [bacterium]